jgi:hypothetical protein
MARNRFRWTRERYRKAHHLNRLLGRHIECWNAPPLVQLYQHLWSEHDMRSHHDPLADPLSLRLARFKGDDIPL